MCEGVSGEVCVCVCVCAGGVCVCALSDQQFFSVV